MSALSEFLQNHARVDAKIAGYVTQTLGLERISDFANFWTSAEYQKGVQVDIVEKVAGFADASSSAAKLQTARLRTAWMLARNQMPGRRPATAAAAVKVAAKVPVETVETVVAAATAPRCVGMGWTLPEVTAATWDGLWAALVFKARNPERFKMDVSNVVVADRLGYLARSLTVNATGKRVEEHIYASERTGEIVYRLVDPATKGETDDERVIAVKESPLRMEFFRRHASDGCRVYWHAPLDAVKRMMQELVDYAAKAEGEGEVVGLGLRSEEIKAVSHDSVWQSMMLSVRDPARFFPCSDVSIKEGVVVQRTLTAGSKTYSENIYFDERSCELVFRKLLNGSETDVERVLALRTHPLQIEFHQRSLAGGFRVQWGMPKSPPLSSVEAFVSEANHMDAAQPMTVGYGITSDPIRDCSRDSLFADVELAIKEPCRVIEVEQALLRRELPGLRPAQDEAQVDRRVGRRAHHRQQGVRHRHIQRVRCERQARGRGARAHHSVERVLTIHHTPLRLELYENNASSGLRLDWQAPYSVARDTFSSIVQMAKTIETGSSDVVGYGLTSKPLSEVSQDELWRAMLYIMRKRAECGLKVGGVASRDTTGCMQWFMRLLGKSGSPTVTNSIRVLGEAQEIAYRPVVNGQEGEEEQVLALRTDPLRLEMFCRHSRHGMRLDWQVPHAVATEVFERTVEVAQLRGAGQETGIYERTSLELGGGAKGGSLSAAHVEHLDPETFRGGLHQPRFHSEGLHMPYTNGGRTYETGFHYLLEAHELGGKNKDGGFGGPLCADPFGSDVQQLCEVLLQEAQKDTTLAFNNFTDPCPSLTKRQVELCKGFDYGDRTLKLPCGPLPWPAGLPEPGYVPKTNPLTGRWITVSGGQAAFIKEAIEEGMLGAAEAHKIMADTDHEQTGGMYLRINQFGDTCTVDTSVAKYVHAKRTWRSGHYFYEPLVSGGNLLGVWVLPEEYRKIGFFWEMDSGRCFRIERRVFERNGLMVLRQTTEMSGKLSFVFYIKVSEDAESQPIPVQSRDYTALAGLDNVPDNLGKPYPCNARDLGYPTKRDTWLDNNEAEMKKQKTLVSSHAASVCDNGFEVHDNPVGGPLSAAHVEALGKEHFEGGLHKPKCHEDGLHKPMAAGGKVYETGFHYLLEAHELGGKNEVGGYGGPLCKDPYSEEATRIAENLLAQAEIDTTLAYHNFKDPCPSLTEEQVTLCKGFDYGDKTLKLPCGPLPWPAGLP